MPRLDKLDLASCPVERTEYAVDAITGIAEYLSHAPGVQTFNKEIADGLRHLITFRRLMYLKDQQSGAGSVPSRLIGLLWSRRSVESKNDADKNDGDSDDDDTQKITGSGGLGLGAPPAS
ncbi:hypothetical protein [Bradyrhizobium sp.]|uniref:hypothetical protein n=1 Tax=Bradyrhizobium sp. TaxID=376 RepID=UPI0026375EDA|nr:hypothetical protein [Bradyrhizobium sp.]